MINMILIICIPFALAAAGLGISEYWQWCCRMADEKTKEGVK